MGTNAAPRRLLSGSVQTVEQFYGSVPLLDASQSIRLLDLSPAARSNQESPLIGHIRVVPLDSAPSYTALSYTWGARADPVDTLQCQPQEFHLEMTANCCSALRHLRNMFGAITIWVDCICINQANEQEKAAQIPLMNRIYAGCQKLYIWLGLGNKISDKTMDYLALCAKMNARLPFDLVTSRETEWHGEFSQGSAFLQTSALMWRARMRTLREAPARLHIWCAHRWIARGVDLDELFAREWIQRAWTFQEIILSPNPIIVCGNRTLAWEDLLTYLLFRDMHRQATRYAPDPLNWLGPMPPATEKSLETWQSTITMWLQFGGHRYNTEDVGEGARLTFGSNHEKLVALDEYNKVARLLKDILAWILGPVVFFAYLVASLYIVGAIAAATGSGVVILIGALLYFALFQAQFLLLYRVSWTIWCIIFGFRTGWMTPYYQPSTIGAFYLQGIRVALRERRANQPHDMVYSMLAIIGPMGLTNHPIDYRQSPAECFQRFLTSLIRLHPPAITMLCDAGISATSPPWTGPSWVPNWAISHPNPAISLQYAVPAHSNPDNSLFTLTTGPYHLAGTTLNITSASFVGRITFATPNAAQSSALDPDHGRFYPLPELMQWYHQIQNQSIWYPAPSSADEIPFQSRMADSAMFSCLEGLERARRDVVYTVEVHVGRRGRGGRRGHMRPQKREREPYEAPLDFSDREVLFRDFVGFKRVLEVGGDWETVKRGLRENVDAAWYGSRVVAEVQGERDRVFVLVTSGQGGSGVIEAGDQGRFIGTAPAAAKVGDYVFRLPGVPSCMVLRDTVKQGEYRVVGSALLPMMPDALPEMAIALV